MDSRLFAKALTRFFAGLIIVAALIYFVLTLTVTRLLKMLEKRMDGSKEFVHASSTMPILFLKKPGEKNGK